MVLHALKEVRTQKSTLATALEFQHFLPRQIKCRENDMKIHFASALAWQCFCRGW